LSAAAAFLALLRAAFRLVQQVIGIKARLGQETLVLAVGHVELRLGPAGCHRFGFGRLAILVRIAFFHAALALARLVAGAG